ncbi:MAG: MBL fold metallo-hydrolase [Candidatus Omnitrophota bacterium]|nr:MAG: MBL fold metallo-hydrolase [Candidatus Omnitrophota bacterium]
MNITITYVNQLHNKSLKSGWGFSCLIEYLDKKVLFDTGDSPEKLSFNLSILNINPKDINAVVLSHNHSDHTGGLEAVIDKNKNVALYFPKSFPKNFREKIKAIGAKPYPVTEMVNISPQIFAGPQMNGFGPKEIPLALQSDKGTCIITGCAHPGILKMVKTVKEKLNKNIYLVMGGFHLEFFLGTRRIVEGFRKIGVVKVAPCHCTGKRPINLFEDEFKKDFIRVGTGLKLEV